jgi:hypothetical protein
MFTDKFMLSMFLFSALFGTIGIIYNIVRDTENSDWALPFFPCIFFLGLGVDLFY